MSELATSTTCVECKQRSSVYGSLYCGVCQHVLGVDVIERRLELQEPEVSTEDEIRRQVELNIAYANIDEYGRAKEPRYVKPSVELPPLPPGAGVPQDFPRGHPLSRQAPRVIWEFVDE